MRNARWTHDGMINAEINHPRLGWIPITLSETDPATAALFRQARAGSVLPAHAAPPRDATLTKVDFLSRALTARILTPEQAREAARGDIPAEILQRIPAADREMAEIIWPAATRIDRLDPFIAALGVALNLNDAQLDALFGIDGGAA